MITLFRRIRQKLIDSGSMTRYLLYAIGEILLVVIGILIALQVNNWNEERKELLTAEELKQAIITDLQSDMLTFDSVMKEVKMRTDHFDSLQAILVHSSTTEDEVIDIIKNDFVSYISNFPGFNDNTYRSASSSGLISVLKDYDRAALYELYLAQTESMRVIEEHQVMYFNLINSFVSKYPINVPFITFNAGPVYERIWNNIDFDDLVIQFNAAGTSQRNYYRIVTGSLNEMMNLTSDAIQDLDSNQ